MAKNDGLVNVVGSASFVHPLSMRIAMFAGNGSAYSPVAESSLSFDIIQFRLESAGLIYLASKGVVGCRIDHSLLDVTYTPFAPAVKYEDLFFHLQPMGTDDDMFYMKLLSRGAIVVNENNVNTRAPVVGILESFTPHKEA